MRFPGWAFRGRADEPAAGRGASRLLICPHCGQSYNPRYILYCARCGEPVPDEHGRLPRPGPLDGMGARGGAVRRLTGTPAAPMAAARDEGPAPDWQPPQAVADMVAEYRNQLAEHPEDHATRFALGLAYCLARRWREAEAELRIVTEAQPGFADAFARLAQCRHHLGDRAGALEAVRRAQALEPGNTRYAELQRRMEQDA